MKVVIMAGGSGTRLWPVSRESYPKQFIKINGESLLLKTYKRFLKIVKKEDIFIIAGEKYKFHILNELSGLNERIEENLILEPSPKNTAGAIILSFKFLKEKKNLKNTEYVFFSPADHIIMKEDEFAALAIMAEKKIKDGIITFGIKPSSPHTGYGYIKAGKKIDGLIYKVEMFTEKPDFNTAKRYLESGNYFWNSGMFMFLYSVIENEFKKYKPELHRFFSFSYKKLLEKFNEMESISIDYSIMEKTKKAYIVVSDIMWSDIGAWEAFGEVIGKDENGNIKIGDVINVNLSNSIIYSTTNRVISAIDVDNLVIVDTEDALLVMKKGSGEKVKDIVSLLKSKQKKEVFEHLTIYRPWGSYTVLEEGPRYKIKRIFVKPKHKLSEQLHYHRSEHWVVIKGTAKVTIDDKEYLVHENESIYVPKSTKHRLENPGKVSLELIEVQNGEYVGEDDIVRFDDVYGRN